MKEIASALVKAQKEFGPALKSSTNPAFRSRYADLSACVEAVIDALNNNDIFMMQPTHECDNGVIVETIFANVRTKEAPWGYKKNGMPRMRPGPNSIHPHEVNK